MEALLAIIVLVFYIFSFWVIIRVIRAIERIADNLGTIGRAHTRSADGIGRIAAKVERITDNENTRE